MRLSFFFTLLILFVACKFAQENKKIVVPSEPMIYREFPEEDVTIEIPQEENTFIISGFSDEYYAKVYIKDSSEVFSTGWVGVYEKGTNNNLIYLEVDEIYVNFHNGELQANIHELPYGEQSVIIYDDFNFDGEKDFALMEGMNSCYHGPSFNIYLYDGNNFTLDPNFSSLAQNYCGMFSWDSESQRISTMTKSGCCYHEYSTFEVENNIPVEVYSLIVDSFDFPYNKETTREKKGDEMVETSKIYLEVTSVDTICSFQLENKGKTVLVYKFNERLSYALLLDDNLIEFDYAKDVQEEGGKSDFVFKHQNGSYTLDFRNKNVNYQVYEKGQSIGVNVIIGKKEYHLPGNTNTKEGSLKQLLKTEASNLEIG